MSDSIVIVERPDFVSFDDIHKLLQEAHTVNRDRGFTVNTADMDAAQLEEHIGETGTCFVALDRDRPVGVTAVRVVRRNNKFARGDVADQILVAVAPDYAGKHISSRLHEKVVEFAKSRGLDKIELRTALQNVRMQAACGKWGFHYIDFAAFPGIDHYNVIMMKWLDREAPAQKARWNYRWRRAYVMLRYRPGGRKRFGV